MPETAVFQDFRIDGYLSLHEMEDLLLIVFCQSEPSVSTMSPKIEKQKREGMLVKRAVQLRFFHVYILRKFD